MSASSNNNERNPAPSATLKIALFAPMPRANAMTATGVKTGCLNSIRNAYRKS